MVTGVAVLPPWAFHGGVAANAGITSTPLTSRDHLFLLQYFQSIPSFLDLVSVGGHLGRVVELLRDDPDVKWRKWSRGRSMSPRELCELDVAEAELVGYEGRELKKAEEMV